MKKLNVIIVDDHKLFREGIQLILQSFEFIDTVFHASNGKEFLEIIERFEPDIALIDINMPVMDGISATQKAKQTSQNIKIVALSMLDNINYYKKILDAGADGFILKDTDSVELKLAIKRIVYENEKYFSQKLLQRIFIDKNHDPSGDEDIISKREMEVLQCFCKGMTAKEIGKKLYISPRTVERHRENLFKKTNTKNTISLIIYAIQNNIIDI